MHDATRLANVKMLLTVTTNGNALPSIIEELWSDSSLIRMDLQPLESVDVRKLTDSLIPGGLGQVSAARLAETCEGNPRLLLEVVRAAIEQRTLTQSEGCWHFPKDRFPFPTSVLELIDPELRKLSEADREIIEVIALAGEPRLSSVKNFCDIRRLERLEQEEVIRTFNDTSAGSALPRVMIRHPLLRYAMSCRVPPLRQRRLLHDWLAANGGLNSLISHDDCKRLTEWHLNALEAPPRALLQIAIEQSFREQALPNAVRFTKAAWQYFPAEETAELHARALIAAADFAELSSFLSTVRTRKSGSLRALEGSEIRGLLLQARYGEMNAKLPGLPAREQLYYQMAAYYFQGRFALAYETAEAIRQKGPEIHSLEAGMIMMGSLCHRGFPEQALSLHRTLRVELERTSGGPLPFHVDSLEELHASALHYCGRFDEAEGIYWREYTQALEKHHVRLDAQRGLALAHLLYDRGIVERALKCATFTSSYQVGWRQWQVKAGIHAALAATSLPIDLRPEDPIPKKLTYEEAGHCAMFFAVVEARRKNEIGEIEEAANILHKAVKVAQEDDAHADVAIGLHECARLSLPTPAVALEELHLEGTFLRTRIEYVLAYQEGDPKRMGRVAREFAETGALLFAAEAYAEQARLHQRYGNEKAATAATTQARGLLSRCGPVATTPLRFLGQPEPISDRERTIAGLAAHGLQDKEIAERLCLSVRTVSNTLYRVYRKVGAANRRELQVIMTGGSGPGWVMSDRSAKR
ncbi:LuxR C-terminal-related transcriptional regulator [Streptomyces sp. NPDC001139]